MLMRVNNENDNNYYNNYDNYTNYNDDKRNHSYNDSDDNI